MSRYVGKSRRLERRDDGTVRLRAVAMVPESQLWTLEDLNRSRIERGLAWAAANKPEETDVEVLWSGRSSRPSRARARGR